MKKCALSKSQERLWVEWKLESDNYAYNNPLMYKLTGDLNASYLEQALQYVVDRHTALRTFFHEQGGRPYQAIMRECKVDLEYVDLTIIPEHERDAKLENVIVQNVRTAFDITKLPLFRFSLIKQEDAKYFLILNIHHIVVDGYSASILLADISNNYNKLMAHTEVEIEPTDSEYIDFITTADNDQAKFLNNKEYWCKTLNSCQSRCDFHAKAEVAAHDYLGGRKRFSLTKLHSDALQQLIKSTRTTSFLFLISAFYVLLRKYTNSSDFCIGYPIENRPKHLKHLFGFFVNNLPLRIHAEAEHSFLDLLETVKQQRQNDKKHANIPLQYIVDSLRESGSLTSNSLYNVSFIRANFALVGLELANVQVEPLQVYTNAVKDDLALLFDQGEQFYFEIEYRLSLFDDTFIEQFTRHYQTLLIEIVNDPSKKLSEYQFLSDEERLHLLNQLSSTDQKLPPVNSIIELFEKVVVDHPHQIAIKMGEQQLTYHELNSRANQIANLISNQGVKQCNRIALLLDRSIDLVATMLAVQKLGLVYIPLDPDYPAERILTILHDARPSLIVSNTSCHEWSEFNVLNLSEVAFQSNSVSSENIIVQRSLTDLVYILFTSGSTGKPKGVEITNLGLLNFLQSMRKEIKLKASDNLLAVTTVAFDISGLEIYLPLLCGSRLTLASKAQVNDPQRIAELINNENISVLQATPATWDMLVCSGWQGKADLKALSGGDRLTEKLAKQLLSRVECLWNLYGPTETTIWSSISRVMENTRINLGKPLDNTQLYILDEKQQLLPQGAIGELYIGGFGLARGYLNLIEQTEKSFLENPYINETTSERIYRTGDLVILDASSNLIYMGRADSQVKIRGFRIELSEIEACLNKHSAISQAVVLVHKVNNNDLRIVAFVKFIEVESHNNIAEQDLNNFLNQFLPSYMLVSHYIIVDSFPLTKNNKVDRKALSRVELQLEQASSIDDIEMPNTELQRELAELFSQVLNCEKICVNTSFFMQGGHSLLATVLLAKIKERYCIDVPFDQFYFAPNIKFLETYIMNNTRQVTRAIHKADLNTPAELSYAQEAIWLTNQIQKDDSAYNMAAKFVLPNNVDLIKLHAAFVEVINKHPSLRTNFKLDDQNNVTQQIAVEIDFAIELSQTSEEFLDTEILSYAKQRFDLSQGPLIRAKLLNIPEQASILVIALHHIIADGWSIKIFLDDLIQCYNQPATRSNVEGYNYIDYSKWQRSDDYQKLLHADLEYWQGQFNDFKPHFFPVENESLQIQQHQGARSKFVIEIAGLHKFSQQHGLSLNMLFLANLAILFHNYSEVEQFCIGTVSANRNNTEFENTIGCFINILPILVDLTGDPSILELLQRIKSTLVGAIQHQNAPFEKVLQSLRLPRNINNTPLFNVMYVYHKNLLDDFYLDGVKLAGSEVNIETAKYDLLFDFQYSSSQITATLEYDTSCFTAATIEKLIASYQEILTAMIAAPHAKLTSFIAKLSSPELCLATNTNNFTMLSQNRVMLPPGTQLEKNVTKLWQNLLGISEISLLDNFFSIGGYSLLAIKFINRLSSELDQEIPLYILFANPQLNEFCHAVEVYLVEQAEIKDNAIIPPAISKLSKAEQALLYFNFQNPESSAYNISVSLHLHGDFDFDSMQSAFQAVIQKHPALRTRYLNTDSGYVRDLVDEPAWKIDHLSAANSEELITDYVNQVFAIDTAPLLRVGCIRIQDDYHQLILVINHLIADEWSVELLMQDLAEFYNSSQPLNASLKSKYDEDYFKTLASLQTQAQFSNEYLQQFKQFEVTQLPHIQQQTAVKLNSHTFVAVFPQALTNIINAYCRTAGVSLYVCLLAGFKTLLRRYIANDQLVVGGISANRDQACSQNIISYLANPIVLVTQLTADQNFKQSCTKVAKSLSLALQNSHIPYVDLIDAVQQQYPGFSGELFNILFTLQNQYSEPEFDNLDLKITENFPGQAKFELSCIARENSRGELEFTIEFDKNKFTEAMLQSLFLHYQNILADSIQRPECAINKLNYLLESEVKALLPVPSAGIKPEDNIVKQFVNTVAKYPVNIAIEYDDLKLSYQDLALQVDVIAANIWQQLNLNSHSEHIIGVCLANPVDYVYAILAILKTGSAFLPLDVNLPQQRIDYMCQDSELSLLITDSDFQQNNSIASTDINSLKHKCESAQLPAVNSSKLAYVIYTSGTTGNPKGVLIEHGAIINFIRGISKRLSISKQDRMLRFASVNFDASIWEIFISLLNGCCLCIPSQQQRLVSEPLQEYICNNNITTAILTPTVLSNLDSTKVTGLDKLAVGGEKLNQKLVVAWNSGRKLFNAYGPTEAAVCACVSEPLACNSINIGSGLPNVELLVLDQDQNMLPVGVYGELYIGGNSLARGYLNQAELTEQKFINLNVANKKQRFYRTGDLVRWKNGVLEYLGRNDKQVKIRGVRLELSEIEAQIQAVLNVDNIILDYDSESQLLTAFITNETNLSENQVISLLASKLPTYMLPGQYIFVAEIPKTISGKVDLTKLQTLQLESSSNSITELEPLQQAIANIWSKYLPGKVENPNISYFSLGGNSLQLMQILYDLNSEFKLDLQLKDLLDNQTVACLANLISEFSPGRSDSIKSIARESKYYLAAPSQQQIYLQQSLARSQNLYNIPLCLKVSGLIGPVRFFAALERVVARHEVLMTNYIELDGELHAFLRQQDKIEFSYLPIKNSQSELDSYYQELTKTRFDLQRDQLFKVNLLESDNCGYLLLCFHHIIFDAWSLQIFLNDLNTALSSEVSINNLELDYLDYSYWCNEQIKHNYFSKQVDFWIEKLQGIQHSLDLPYDLAQNQQINHHGKTVTRKLSIQLSQQLNELAQGFEVSTYVLFLSLWELFLSKYTSQYQFVVGTAVANRENSATQSMLGLFTNTLALPVNINGDASFKEFVTATNQLFQQAQLNQSVPFYKVIEALNSIRPGSGMNLFNVFYNYSDLSFFPNQLHGYELKQVDFANDLAKFALHLHIKKTSESIFISIEYSTELFSEDLINSMQDYFEQMIINCSENPEQKINQIELYNTAALADLFEV